jgi:hypothetical protein
VIGHSRDECRQCWPRDTEESVVRFEGVDPGRYLVFAFSTAAPSAVDYADVTDGGTTDITLRLGRGVGISGIVVDDLDEPIADVFVYATGSWPRDDAVTPGSYDQATTDASGSFRLARLRAGLHALTTSSGGHANASAVRFDAPANDVRLVLARTATAKLRALAPVGVAPPADLWVRSEIPMKPATGGEGAWTGGGADGRPFGDGRIVVEGVTPGRCRIRMMTKEFAPLVREFVAKPGETIDLGDATLDPGVDVAGRVEDAAGTPIVGARVTTGGAYAGDTVSPDVRKASTAADGSFRLEHMTTGPLDLTVAAPEFVRTTTRVDAAPGGGAVVVRLYRGALLTVKVVDAAGVPIPGASIVARAANSTSDAATDRADHRGVAELRVAPGKVRVAVDGKDVSAEVELVEGGDMSVRLVAK